MKLNPQIFREYDIRGYVDKDLSVEFANLLGRAYGTLAADEGKKSIAICYDCRHSSQPYAEALANGMASEGIDATILGMGATPQLYYAIYSGKYEGGIQVTGSHNPSDMNGFKICLGKKTLSGEQIQELYKRMTKLQDTTPDANLGTVSESPIADTYLQELIENCKPHMGPRKLKVVVDAGNGVGGMIGPALLEGLGVEVKQLYCEPDGSFPNHHPDPTVLENLTDLIDAVKKEKADFGIGWDGDGDRIGVVDENGSVVFGDMLVLIYARSVLKEEPGTSIIGDVKCSSNLFDGIEKAGGKAIMWKTGHSLIKSKLQETGAALAGEMSGHIFFKHRYYGFDDAAYCSARLAEIVSKHEGPFSSLLGDLPPTVSTPEIRVDCPEEIKFEIASKAPELFSDYQVDTTDGARISFEDGWGLVRASNTQPVLVLRFEATNEEALNSYQKLVTDRIEKLRSELSNA